MTKKEKTYLVLIIAITLSVIFPCLNNGFTNWDDPHYVLENPYIKDFSVRNIVKIFTSDLYGKYNPLALLSFVLEYQIAAEQPFLYHWDNLLLHLINVALVFGLLRMLFGDLDLAFLTALLFAIHPMQVESFAWISGRKDVLFGTFYLAGLCRYVRYRVVCHKSDRQSFLIFVFFLLSLLTKPMAVSFPLVLLLIDYYSRGKLEKEDFLRKASLFLSSILFGVLTLVNAIRTNAFPASNIYHWPQRIELSLLALLNYLQKIILPVKLSCFYPIPDSELTLWQILPGLSLSILLLLFVACFVNSRRVLVFGISFFLATIVFVLHIFAVNDSIIYDRFIYVPGIGIYMILASIFLSFVEKLREKGKMSIFAGFLLLLIYWTSLAEHTIQRCYVWRNSLTLWSDVLDNYPQASVAYHNRGAALSAQGWARFALMDLQQAIKLDPSYASAYFNRGNIYAQERAIAAAIKEYDQAIALDPAMVNAYINRGNMQLLLGNWQQALLDYQQALARDANNVTALLNRGMAYVLIHDIEKATRDFSRVLELDPTNTVAIEKRKEFMSAVNSSHP
jgi:protein O-mannosyl-transferase